MNTPWIRATKSSRSRRQRATRASLMIERLEERTLLAIVVTDAPFFQVTINDADDVAINCDAGQVRVIDDGVPATYETACAAVTGIRVSAAGNFANTIDLSAVALSDFPVSGSTNITGGEGNDSLIGSPGNDTYLFNPTATADTDTISELANGGIDTLNFSLNAADLLTVNLNNDTPIATYPNVTINTAVAGQAANFENVSSSSSNDNISGNAADNRLSGGNGNDTLAGGPGNDSLIGGRDDDSLVGGPGNDSLEGGRGNDILIGGGGNDVYVFKVADNQSETDTVNELTGEGFDRLDFSALWSNDPVTIDLGLDMGLATHTSNAGTPYTRSVNTATAGQFLNFEAAFGGAGNDSITGGSGVNVANFLKGNAGDDTMLGDLGDDTISGDTGHDLILAGDGLDSVLGGRGNDTIDGSDGNDILFGNEGHDSAFGGFGDDTLFGNANTDTLDGGDNHDRLDGGDHNDSLIGGERNDTFTGGLGNDTIDGGADVDFILESNAVTATLTDSVLSGLGLGTDVFTSIKSAIITGDAAANAFDAAGFVWGPVTLDGLGGNDTIIGGPGADSLFGGDNHDDITGLLGADTFNGGAGTDRLIETHNVPMTLTNTSLSGIGAGVDSLAFMNQAVLTGGGASNPISAAGFTIGQVTLVGLGGNDSLVGGSLSDSIVGGDGVDTLTGGGGNDTIDGGLGGDLLKEFASFNLVLTNSSLAGVGNDSLASIERAYLIGGTLNNHFNAAGFSAGQVSLFGGAGNDTLIGGTLSDSLFGGDGDDSLSGGSGNDTLDGGNGTDTGIGGLGADFFNAVESSTQ